MLLRNTMQQMKNPLRELIWYRCNAGHFTPCRTPSMRNFFCKLCNKIISKQISEKYTDSSKCRYKIKRKHDKIEHKYLKQKRVIVPITPQNGEIVLLTLYNESSRKNYRKK